MSESLTPKSQRGLLLIILVGYLIVAGLFAVFTPLWEAPDEPAHYNYVAQVAHNGCCPVIEPGDWNSPYLEQLKAAHFAPQVLGNLNSVQYEDHQPPLYYFLQVPVFDLTNGSLIAMRLLSVILGAGIVVCAYGIGLLVLPGRPQVALATAALVAFLPQHVAIIASANNDALGNLIIAATLLATIAYLKDRNIKTWQLGLLVGIGLLTKVSTLFLVGIVGLAILLKWWGERRNTNVVGTQHAVSSFFRAVLAFAVPMLILGGIWWAHSISVYGFPDIFGLRQHDRVVADQARTADLIAQIGWGSYLDRAVHVTFNSFWGQFGWMALPLPQWIYQVIEVLLLICLSGLVVNFLTTRRNPALMGNEAIVQRNIWLVLLATIVLAVLAYLYYNTVFLQLQGRYMFPGLIPFALLLALGVDGWRDWLTSRIGRGASPAYLIYVTIVPFALFAVLDVYLLWRVIVPGLKP